MTLIAVCKPNSACLVYSGRSQYCHILSILCVITLFTMGLHVFFRGGVMVVEEVVYSSFLINLKRIDSCDGGTITQGMKPIILQFLTYDSHIVWIYMPATISMFSVSGSSMVQNSLGDERLWLWRRWFIALF